MSISTLRELIRLIITTNLSNRRISRILALSPNTVRRHRDKCRENRFTWKELSQMKDSQLIHCFNSTRDIDHSKRMPDWLLVHRLMQIKHQTLIQFWEEYRLANPDSAYSYSQYTHHYREFVKTIDISMRQVYIPGEVVFVDFAGKRLSWTDPKTGEVHYVELFVSVLGNSQLIFAIAVRSQQLEEWIIAHEKMFAYYGGVPQLVVPDNLRSAVTKAGPLPTLNRTYQELAQHYQFTIEPARVRRPQDKSLAEIGVLLVTRWIIVVLKRRRFFSIAEINEAIAELLEKLNRRPFKRLDGNRRSRFEESEKAALQSLPACSFDFGHWVSSQKVPSDYHVYVLGHAYSVPYQLVGQRIEARVGHQKVEFFHQNRHVAIHVRSFVKGGTTTENNHRPVSHQAYAAQSKAHFICWAEQIGPNALAVVMAQFDNKPEYSIKGCKASSRLQKLAKQYGANRFENACQCAAQICSLTVSSVRSILQCRLDTPAEEDRPVQAKLPLHHNVRGSDYYINRGT